MLNRKNQNQSRLEDVDLNQTEFAIDQTFYSNNPNKLFNFKQLKKNRNVLPFYILMGILLFFFALMIIVALSKKAPQEEEKKIIAPTENINNHPLQIRIDQLQADLKEADPTRQILPFPRINMEFNLD